MKKTLHDYEWITDVRIGDFVQFECPVPATGNWGTSEPKITNNGGVIACANANPECFFVEAIDGNVFTVFPFEMKILSRID